tara:strand:- start:243 stop:371 length:129 start_codon:yes stop_codon:yes gene_type:complete
MTYQEWMELGYTQAEAKELVIEAKLEQQYEENAHRAFYSRNL